LRGYLLLGHALLSKGSSFAAAWNFGPTEAASVREVVTRLASRWDRVNVATAVGPVGPHEAAYLTLDSSRAQALLGWSPWLDLGDSLAWTIDWYRRFHEDPRSAQSLVREQIHKYESRDSVEGVG
jgi:CDP-glucose 4,6-dehydratase